MKEILQQRINLLQVGDVIHVRFTSINDGYYHISAKISNIDKKSITIDTGIFRRSDETVDKSKLSLVNNEITYTRLLLNE